MNLIKVRPDKIIDIDTGMIALYKFVDEDDQTKPKQINELIIEYSYPKDAIREFYDYEATELWIYLGEKADNLPNVTKPIMRQAPVSEKMNSIKNIKIEQAKCKKTIMEDELREEMRHRILNNPKLKRYSKILLGDDLMNDMDYIIFAIGAPTKSLIELATNHEANKRRVENKVIIRKENQNESNRNLRR